MKGKYTLKPHRILYVNGGTMQRGGIESFMMAYYRNIDRKKVQIDFIVHGYDKGVYDEEILSLGGKIYNIPIKSKNILGNILKLRSIFKNNDYKLVHSHLDAMSTLVLKVAKECGIPIRIAHSHNINHLTNNRIKYIINEQSRKKINYYATDLFACSVPAGKWLFGDNQMDSGNVKIIKNAIEIEPYKYNEKIRDEIRKKLSISDELVLGHVGRFDYQKNHDFLIDVFYGFQQVHSNSILVLIGDGVLKDEIQDKITRLKINDKVRILGSRNDVNNLLNIFDVFLLPSKFEGLGISLIEAQANGLKCITSTNTPKEVNISQDLKFLGTDKNDIKLWIEEILKLKNYIRSDNTEKLINAGYDIKNESVKLQKIYLDLLEG